MNPNITRFIATSSPSWTTQLNSDPDFERHRPNKISRQVFSGHYVPVKPTPLPNPRLLSFTPAVAELLGLDEEACSTEQFSQFFSGDVDAFPGLESWATPYALSIYGQKMYDNCPFKTGNGYGDGRAISVAEVVNENGERWEMQLKGAGTTPWCRGGDGRAVLRSSIREYLASEAMHNLGISSTRALSLIVSKSETVQRPWFSGTKSQVPKETLSVDDPRLRQFPMEQRRQLVEEYNRSVRQARPDVMATEACTIACRVAPSFTRVGHIELFARRFAQSKSAAARDELRLIVEHTMFREFGGPVPAPPGQAEDADFQDRVLSMLRECSQRFANLTAAWIRVGFCQGNFNSDNCLVGGRTMDYGPFGFMEKYVRDWNMWVGGGAHYSFRNQHIAGAKNFESLAESVALLLDKAGNRQVQEIIEAHFDLAAESVQDVFIRKLGLTPGTPIATKAERLIAAIDKHMEDCGADYTMFWRQLAVLPETLLSSPEAIHSTGDDWAEVDLLQPLQTAFGGVFYNAPLSQQAQARWVELMRSWLSLVREEIIEQRSAAGTAAVGAIVSAADAAAIASAEREGSAKELQVDTEVEAPAGPIASSLGAVSVLASTSSGAVESAENPFSGVDIAARMRQLNPKYVPREWMLVEAYTSAQSADDWAVFNTVKSLFEHPYDEQPEYEALYYRRTPEESVDKPGTSSMT